MYKYTGPSARERERERESITMYIVVMVTMAVYLLTTGWVCVVRGLALLLISIY